MSEAQRGPRVVGETAADRLLRSLDYRSSEAEFLSLAQVAVVLRALADHTAIMAALDWRVDASSPWPQALSMGRWFHDVADQIESQMHTKVDPIRGAQLACEKADARLEAVLTAACPGRHDYVRHEDDGQPSWCPSCRRTVYGDLVP